MTRRNMWISEPGPRREVTLPGPKTKELGDVALGGANDAAVSPQDGSVAGTGLGAVAEAATATPDQTNLLADTGQALDDLVPRTWQKWE